MTDYRKLPSRDKYPCYVDGKHCEKRHLACQDTCPDMLAAQKANNERKTVERQKRALENAPTEYSIERQLKAQRKKLKER